MNLQQVFDADPGGVITEVELAEALGVTTTTVCRWRAADVRDGAVGSRTPRYLKLASKTFRYRVCHVQEWLIGKGYEPAKSQKRACA